MISSISSIQSISKIIPPIPAEKLLLRYDFSYSGTTILDKSGMNRNATLYGTNYITPLTSYPNTSLQKKNTYCYSLPTSSQAVDSGNYIKLNSSFPVSSKTFSVSFWILPLNNTSTGDSKVWEIVSEKIHLWRRAYVTPYFGILFNLNYTTNVTLSIGVWNHIVVNYDSSTMRLSIYQNNTLTYENLTITTSNLFPSFTFPDLIIGRPLSTLHHSFTGNIADFRVYSTVLTTAEINDLYNGTI